MKFRKKPVVIEATAWLGETIADHLKLLDVQPFLADMKASIGSRNGKTGLIVHTLEGDMLAEKGDWIIKDAAGEYYPCKPDMFVQTYEPVEDK